MGFFSNKIKKKTPGSTAIGNNDKWYSGDTPTRKEILGRIEQISNTNPAKSAELYDQYVSLINDPSSPLFNAYASPTNKATTYLEQVGLDSSKLNSDFINRNRAWINERLIYNGTTNTPSKPGKKATQDQQIAYWLYQWDKSEGQTQKAEDERKAVMEEAAFWTNFAGRNYSDDEVRKKVNTNFAKKYPTLSKMKDSSFDPMKFNRAIDWSDDVLDAAIWMARNPDYDGSVDGAIAYNYLGYGKTWQEDPEIAKKIEPLMPDGVTANPDYNAYALGSTTLDDAARYFGLYSFPQGWLEENISLKYNGTDEEKKYYEQIEEGEKNWNSADTAAKAVNGYIDSFLFDNKSANAKDIQDKLDAILNSGEIYVKTANGKTKYSKSERTGYTKVDLSILNKMDITVGKDGSYPTGKLLPMTRGIDYKYDDVVRHIRENCERNSEILDDTDAQNTFQDDAKETEPAAVNTPEPAQEPETATQEPVSSQEPATAMQEPAEEQEPEAVSAAATAMNAANARGETAEEEPEQTAEPAATAQANQPKYYYYTEAEKRQVSEKNRKIAEAAETVSDYATDDESTVMKYAGSVIFEQAKQNFTAMRVNPAIVKGITKKAISTTSKAMITDSLDTAHEVARYQTLQSKYDADKARYSELEAKYGDIEKYQKEFQDQVAIQVGDYTVELTYRFAPKYARGKNAKAGYQVTNIYSGDMNATYDMIREAGRDQEIIAQAQGEIDRLDSEALTALSVENTLKILGEDAENEIREYNLLAGKIGEEEAELESGREKNEQNLAALEKASKKMGMMYASAVITGADTSGIDEAYDFLDDVLQYYDEPQLPINYQTKLEYINELEEMSGTPMSNEQKSGLLHESIDAINKRIEKIHQDMDYAEKTGYQIPERYQQNMEYTLQDLENEKKAFEYSAILTDTDPEELEKAIEAGKAFEEKYADDMQTWQGLYGTEDNPEYFFTLGQKTQATTNDDESLYPFITDDDRKVYYYLLGKKVQELGGELENVLGDESAQRLMTQEAKGLVTDILKNADDFVEFMNNEDVGVWTAKRSENAAQMGADMVASGAGWGTAANLVSTAVTPFESLVNIGYSLDRLLRGGRMSGIAPSGLIGKFKTATREATFRSIDETFSDNPTMKYVARLGYEIYCNQGDSIANAMFFGALLPGTNIAMLDEFIGAAPMGFTAARQAAEEAVANGASMEQAWFIFGTTFLAETASEAVTYSNIRGAFDTVEELSKESLKQFAVDWLTSEGVEELIGETSNQAFENWANKKATEWFDNPNYESDHQRLIDQFYAQGYTEPGEAEAKAYEQEMKDLVHTAFVSYLTPGTNVLTKAGVAATNTARTAAEVVNGYRINTRRRQKLGFNESMLGNMVRDAKRARRQSTAARSTTTTTQASEQDASAAAPENAAPATTETAPVTTETAPVTTETTSATEVNTPATETAAATEETTAPATEQAAEETAEDRHEALQNKYLDAQNRYDEAAERRSKRKDEMNAAKVEYGEAVKSGDAERIENAKARLDEAQRAYNAARVEAAELANARDDARFELEDYEEKAEAEAATPEDKQTAADVAALERNSGSSATSQTELIASVLDDSEGDEAASDQASAAAAYLGGMLGDDTSYTVQQVMTGAMQARISTETVKTALKNAALGNGAATEVIQSEAFRNASITQKAQMLAATVEADQANPDVQQNIADRTKDFRVTRGISELAANGHFDQATKARKDADKAAAATAEARTQLQEKQDAAQAAQEDLETKQQQFDENPQNRDLLKELEDSVNRRDRADESQHQYEQHLENTQEAQDAAEAEADQAASDAMDSARETSEQGVQQVNQQRQEVADQQAEQARIDEENAKKAQAEEDKRTGKTQEEIDNAKIDRFVDSSVADEETKERVRKMLKDRRANIRESKVDLSGRLTDAESMLALGALQRKLGIPIMFSDELGAADGMYSTKNNVIYLNARKAKDGSMKLGQALVEVAMHEITHSLEQTKHYTQYRQIVLDTLFGKGDQFDGAAYDNAIRQKQDQYRRNGEELTEEGAEKEIIADFAKKRLAERDVVQRFMDAGLGGKMRNMLHNINQALKNFFKKMTDADREAAENLRKAERAFQKAINERDRTAVHPGADQFSIAQFAQATNMQYDEKTLTLYRMEGDKKIVIDGVSEDQKVTPQMIQQTPVGKLIRLGLKGEQQQKALEMFAGLMNMIAMLKDQNLVWEIAGGTLESTFSALKANADTQYHDTIDFGTICAKTQAIVNVMSRVMLDRLEANRRARAEGRMDDISYGLTRDDVLKIYDETHKAGLSVPCPVCYVFSHWMGVPSLLGQMSRFQHDYIVTGVDTEGKQTKYGDAEIEMDENGYARFDRKATEENARAYIERMHSKYGGKDGVDEQKKKITSAIDKGQKKHQKLAAEIEKIKYQLKSDNLQQRTRDSLEKKLAQAEKDLEKNAREISENDERLREFEAYNWVTQSLMKKDKNGNYSLNEDFRITPDEILFDMRRTGEFADRYASNWKYRTSRGAGMGKSILPYSGASLGDIIMGKQTRVATTDNPLFDSNSDEKAQKAIDSARDRAKRQNLIGGQRLQSTSDFRPEWGLDYIMAFLELQAAHSNAQMYTKVAEAVDLFASAGADVNLSIMGLGSGWHVASQEEIAQMTDEQKAASTVEGVVYVMDFSSTTGMEYSTAREKSRRYSNVQMILVGMNDTHIRLALQGDDIDFVIPWHSSGNSREVLTQLVGFVEETLETSSDYTNTQGDKFITRKVKRKDPETGKWKTVTEDARTDEQKTMWSARMKILTGLADKAEDTVNPEKGGLTKKEKDYVFGDKANPFLKDLYERFYRRKGDKCYGVALTSAQAKQIFPYEYWQTDPTQEGGTKATADENGRRFIRYCQAMGVIPRFSGVWDGRGKKVKHGNFAGAVYDDQGRIIRYDETKMQKGYWKLLIDRKMYDTDGNYREQQEIDVSGIQIGEVEGEGRGAHLTEYDPDTKTGSMLPTKTSAKYAGTKPDSPYAALEQQAAEASEAVIRKPFTLKQEGAQMLYNDDYSDAELDDMLRQAGVEYQDAVDSGDTERAQELVDAAAREAGYTDKAYHGTTRFGFTKFDMERGSDAVFVSYNQELAGTYSQGETRRIRDAADRVEYDPSNPEELVQIVRDEKIKYQPDKNKGWWRISDIELDDDGNYHISTRAGDFTISGDELADIISRSRAANRHGLGGVYQLYTRPGKQLVIDAGGNEHNNIPVEWTDRRLTTNEIAQYAREHGYDSVRINNVYDPGGHGEQDSDNYGDVGIFFNPDDVKSADDVTYDDEGKVIPLEERFNPASDDIRYSYGESSNPTDAELDDMLRQAGVLTQEEIDDYDEKTSRPLEGKSTKWTQEQGPAQRQFGGDDGMLQESDEIAQEAVKYVREHNAYFPDTNVSQVIRAINWIRSNRSNPESDGFTESMEKISSNSFDYRSADGQARMVAMMGMAVAKSNSGSADSRSLGIQAQVQLADAFNRQGTDLGRALQARKLFKLMTPAGRIASLKKMMQGYQDQIDQENPNNNIELKFSDWIYQAAAVAETDEDMAKVQAAAAQELADQLPMSWKDRVQSLRMLCMLANPRTHIRNIIGNMMFIPAVGLKNKIGALMELGMEKGKKTKTLAPVLPKAIRDFARQDAKTIKGDLTGESKYNEGTQVKKAQKPLGQVFGLLSEGNSKVLEWEDWLFLRGHYRKALGGWMQANGYTPEQLQNDPTLLAKGREYAINEAQKATYRDFNATAAMLNEMARNEKSKGTRVVGFALNAVMPFKKTPANILKRGIEYSPVGLARGLWNLARKMDKGRMTPNQVIDRIASGLSGTAVMALGYLLAGTGAISCGFDDDDWEEELKGKQKYSLKFNLFGKDVTYTMDWAAPMALPMFVGASIRQQADEDGWDYRKVMNAMASISDPMLELSMLDGVNKVLKVSAYSDGEPIPQIAGKIISNYATSFVPSVLGAIARTIDDTQRKAFVTKGDNKDLEGTFRYAWEQTENKIPFVSRFNIPVRDVWGNARTSSFAECLIENFISPGYVEDYKEDPVINELGRLFDSTGRNSLEPQHAETSFTVKGQKYILGPQEYDTYDRVHGETQYKMLEELFNNSKYQQMTDDEAKADIVSKIYSYAKDVGMNAVDPSLTYERKTVEDIVRDGVVSEYKTKMISAFVRGDNTGFGLMADALRDENVPDSEIKKAIADQYRDQYKEAYTKYLEAEDNNDASGMAAAEDEMEQLEDKLDEDNTGFKFDFKDWQKQAKKKYEGN